MPGDLQNGVIFDKFEKLIKSSKIDVKVIIKIVKYNKVKVCKIL